MDRSRLSAAPSGTLSRRTVPTPRATLSGGSGRIDSTKGLSPLRFRASLSALHLAVAPTPALRLSALAALATGTGSDHSNVSLERR